MAFTDINSEDRLVQKTFADHLHDALGWESLYAWNQETFGPEGTLGRSDTKEVVLTRDLRAAITRFNPELPEKAINEAIEKLTRQDFSRSALQHNQAFYGYIRNGVPVSYRDAKGQLRQAFARVIDFRHPKDNRFLCVRELKITGPCTPNYNRRADLVCFVNGLPLVFIELKAIYKNIRAGFDGNLRDYLDEHVIAHAFHHNAFLIVSNGDRARYGSITSEWDHFAEWKRQDEGDKGSVDAEVLLNGMLARERLLDIVENFILFDASKPGTTRKVVARNHQILGVNRAVASVIRQEELKREFPPGERLRHRVIELPLESRKYPKAAEEPASYVPEGPVDIVECAHPDLGKLGVFWHTQGSGKSYSMAFFTEKVRRSVPGNFTFVLMTDRNDLDSQIYKTFVGCGVAAFAYAERHDNIEAAYKKLTERRDTADVTELLKELHRIVNEAIRAQTPGDDQNEGLTFDLSQIDLEKLHDEFAKKVRRKATALQDIREIVEQKLAEMLRRNPMRMDYYKRYQEIVADYNREKDRATIEETFAKLVDLVDSLDEEQQRAAKEGLNEDELALFDLLKKEKLGKAEREKVKVASQSLLASLHELLAPLERWTEKEQTQAEVETFILDNLYMHLPSPPFTEEDKQVAAKTVYQHVWRQAVSSGFEAAAG